MICGTKLRSVIGKYFEFRYFTIALLSYFNVWQHWYRHSAWIKIRCTSKKLWIGSFQIETFNFSYSMENSPLHTALLMHRGQTLRFLICSNILQHIIDAHKYRANRLHETQFTKRTICSISAFEVMFRYWGRSLRNNSNYGISSTNFVDLPLPSTELIYAASNCLICHFF